jgi:hypothetical protein
VADCKTLTEKAAFINERVQYGPVLVRCTAELTTELEQQGYPLIKVNEDNIDAALLRTLEEQPYKIIVSETQFGMRGIDYRCANGVAITLVIACPFDTTRDAM